MKIEIIPCLNDNYSYLIFEKSTNIVTIVDPSDFKTCDKVLSKYKKLDFILNTHHHADHVGGNLELKEKYSSKIIGYEKDRIPGIDIILKKDTKFKIGSLEFTVIFIPGHTSGHIAFYFSKEKVLFSGDTLFSLGCGRIFEGTYNEMFSSLNKLKKLPPETKIYCGHEYTKNNLEFCMTYDTNNKFLKSKAKEIDRRLKKNLPTIPSNIKEELSGNIFLRCDNDAVKQALNLKGYSDEEIFSKLRDLKDTF